MVHSRLSLLAVLMFSTVAFAQQAPPPEVDPVKQAAGQAAFKAFAQAYLESDWETINEQRATIRQHTRYFTQQQRREVDYMRKTAQAFQPKWWKDCSSVEPVSFRAEIWSRKFTANYKPGRSMGYQSVRAGSFRRRGRQYQITALEVRVSWKPGMVNDPTRASGELAETHGLTRGDIAEVIVWHELGHNYLTNALPVKHVVELYNRYELLYVHLQEFYADLTALYHASPRARRAACQLRIHGLDFYDGNEPHTRASHGIGAMLIAEMMLHPEDWPSVHFPPAVPKEQIELNTMIYIYENWAPDWSVTEAKQLRDWAKRFIDKQGERTFKRKGVMTLANRLKFSLMVATDRKDQKLRDAWVAEQLQKLIDAGRADQLEEGHVYDPPMRIDGSRTTDVSQPAPRVEFPR